MFSIDDLKEMANKRDIDYWKTHKKILSVLPTFIENAEEKVFYPANIFNKKKFVLYFFSRGKIESISSDDGTLVFDSDILANIHLELKIQPNDLQPTRLDIKSETGFELTLDALADSMDDTVSDYNEAIKAIYNKLNK
jgi:hypothetical protein